MNVKMRTWLRAQELLDISVRPWLRAEPKAITRQAVRVLRGRAQIWSDNMVSFPAGVLVRLRPNEYQRIRLLMPQINEELSREIRRRLGRHHPVTSPVRVVFDEDLALPGPFAVVAFETHEPLARETLLATEYSDGDDARSYPRLASEDGKVVAVPPSGLELGRMVSDVGRIDDPYCSARHAVVTWGGHDSLEVADLGSKNGTWVDGRRVEAAQLQAGSVLKLGRTTFVVRIEAHNTRQVDELARPVPTTDPRVELLELWESVVGRVPHGQDRIGWLASASRISFKQIDSARLTRNDVAHAVPIADAAVVRAAETLRLVLHRLPEPRRGAA